MSDNLQEQSMIEDLKGSYLTFFIDDSLYGVELIAVTEIIGVQSITPVPGTPDFVVGIMNLRGKIVPLLDVRKKFGLEFKEYVKETSIVVLIHDGAQVGIIVDSVRDVCRAQKNESVNLPAIKKEASGYLSSVVQSGSSLILTLDLDAFLKVDIKKLVK